MVVDVHSHLLPARHARRLAESPEVGAVIRAQVLGAAQALGDVETRLRAMDDAGVDVSVLSLPPPGAGFGDAATSAAAAAEANDDLLAVASEHPGRFAVLAALPVPDAAASVRELERVASHPLVAGVALITDRDRWDPAAAALEPVWAAAAERGLPVMLHPGIEELPAAYGDWNLAVALGAPVSSTLAMLRLALSGMLDRVPGLTAIVPHLGGTWPYLAQRVSDQCGRGDAEHDVHHYLCGRTVLDTCSYHRPALLCALDTVGPERIALGSDYPFRGGVERAIDDIVGAALPSDVSEAVLGGTAHRHLRLDGIEAYTISTTPEGAA